MNKGFTLIELLGVVVLISILSLVVGGVIVKSIKDSKENLYNSQMILIKSAAETWGVDNRANLPNDGECKYITLLNLKEYGLLDEEITNPKTDEKYDDNMKIKITSSLNKYGVVVTKYEVDATDIGGCGYFYE